MPAEVWFCFVVPIAIIVFVLAWSFRQRQAKEAAENYHLQSTDTARHRYQQALRDLKANPSDATKKQHALMLGREYSNLTRNLGGVTLFDEMALMNDLNAATAAVHTSPARAASVSYVPPATPVAAISAPTTAERLRKLDDLKTQGLIDEQEYTDRRTVILNDV